MPSGDRTGPWGRGSRTGRGLGYCSGTTHPGFMAAVSGFGFGRGRGRGLGRGAGFGRGFLHLRGGRFPRYLYPPAVPYAYQSEVADVPPVDEEAYLAEEARALEEELALINKRRDELKKSKPKSKDREGNETAG